MPVHWYVAREVIPDEQMVQALDHVQRIREQEPFPAFIHPIHGDVRPQRLPARNYKPENVPEEMQVLWGVGEALLASLVGHSVETRCALFFYYPPGTQMHEHLDQDNRGDHWRVNIMLRKGTGGDLLLNDQRVDLHPGDAYLFRADRVRHAVTPVTSGERIVWSQEFLVSG